jgi:hypothetical protein
MPDLSFLVETVSHIVITLSTSVATVSASCTRTTFTFL